MANVKVPGSGPPVWVVRAADRLRGVLGTVHRSLVPPNVALIELALGSWASQSLYVAAKLGLADELAAGPLPADELARRVGVDADALFRLMRLLTARSVFRRHRDGSFTLTALGAALRSDAPGSIRNTILFANHPDHWRVWGQLEYSVHTGRPACEDIWRMGFFDYLQTNAHYAAVFNNAMHELSQMDVEALLSKYDFNKFPTIADIGGGHGRTLAAILGSASGSCGILFDSPSVVHGADAVLDDAGVSHRCTVVGGSFFTEVPTGADCYLLKSIIHDWGDEDAARILATVRGAMKSHSTLVIADNVIPETPSRHFGVTLDVDMLVNVGGRERTAAQWRELLKNAGFRLCRTVDTPGPLSIIEAAPA